MAKKMRLDKLLAHMGFGTRSEIKKLAKQGQILVNGRTVKECGEQVDPFADRISVGEEEVVYREFIYLMLNKPQEVISATEDTRERTVLDLLSADYRHFQPFPVGRLDKDTEGLLLLTNDGQLAHRLLSPRKQVPKTYYAEVEGKVDEHDIAAFVGGVALDDGYVTMPAKLVILPEIAAADAARANFSRVELTIMEGKFHQVKRMFQAVGKRVLFLKRIAMGPLSLDERLAAGQYRELANAELELLIEAMRGNGQ